MQKTSIILTDNFQSIHLSKERKQKTNNENFKVQSFNGFPFLSAQCFHRIMKKNSAHKLSIFHSPDVTKEKRSHPHHQH